MDSAEKDALVSPRAACCALVDSGVLAVAHYQLDLS